MTSCSTMSVATSAWEEWAAEEFSGARLKDKRLTKRLVKITGALMAAPGSSVPKACGSWGASKAAYRFFDNKRVDTDEIIRTHREGVQKRAAREKVVLAVADTTQVDFTSHPETDGLGPLADTVHHGMFLQPVLAVTPEGVPLGVIDRKIWVRNIDNFAKGHASKKRKLPIQAKESVKWLESLQAAEAFQLALGEGGPRVISTFDREGDVFDVLKLAVEPGRRSGLVVRAQADRRVHHPQRSLWKFLAAQPRAGTLTVRVGRKLHQKARIATVAIRFAEVVVEPPNDRRASEGLQPIKVHAVYAHEEVPPKGTKAVSWMLLTTEVVRDFDDACRIVGWYSTRWTIELLFRVLKSGCKAEDRQLETAERLMRLLVLDLVVAWRILFLTVVGRETPELSASVVFEEYEWKALYVFVTKSRHKLPKTPPSLREVTRLLGRMGGHLGRKRDGEPGSMTLWRGLQRLPDISEMWQIWLTCEAMNE